MMPTTSDTALKERQQKALRRTNERGQSIRSRKDVCALQCRWVVRQWKLRLALHGISGKLRGLLMPIPWVAELGEISYLLGFWTEYILLQMGRGVWRLLCLAGREALSLYTHRIEPVLRFVGDFLYDIVQPIVQMQAGLAKLHRAGAARRASGEKTDLDLWQGVRSYGVVVARGLSCLLPFAALAVFLFTIHTVQGYRYVLAVQVDDRTVGYVESEQVFDGAKKDVNARVQQALDSMKDISGEDAVTDMEWDITPTFALRVYSGDTMSETAMADAILRASSDQIVEATALYVDKALRAVTTEGDALRAYLASVKEPYLDESDPSLRVEFVRDIQLVDGVYFTESLVDYGQIVDMLSGKEQERRVYVVQAGDTPWQIAAANDLTLNELYEMNPEMVQPGYNMFVGDELTVAAETDFLQVKQVMTRTWQEAIPYDTVTTNSDDYDWGVTKTITEGVEGLQEITADITYINGVKVSTDYLKTTVLKEPVNKEVVKGTHLKSGMVAQYGTGSFMWPVPNYKYVSRWMSSGHHGTDICAAHGTPIVASDSGVVTTAGWHYSYGNYVIIDHGNGYRTLYAHMAYTPSVYAGQGVSQGQIIGYVGNTGYSFGNHCHFEMYYNGVRFSARNIFAGM